MRSSLNTLLDDFARHGRERAIITHRGVRRYVTSYREIAVLAARFAAELMQREIGYGERVVLWGSNSAEWVAALYGCMLRGVIAVPLDTAGSVPFAQRVIAEVQPRLITGDAALLASASFASTSLLAFDRFAASLPTTAAAPATLADPRVTPDTPLQILFTSGTTSEPKGIVHTHRNILSSLEPIEREIGKYLKYERIFHPLRFLHTLPLSHVFGQFMGLWIPPILGAEVHFEGRLQAPHLIRTIHDERISLLIAVPRALELLRSHLLETDPHLEQRMRAAAGSKVWSRWWQFRGIHSAFGYKFWAFICGGASLPPDLEQFWNTLGFALIQGYGMTESSALITLNHPFKIGRGTIGKVLPGRDVQITGEGEILVRGPMISGASWREGRLQPNASEWLATGDLAQKDEAGNLRFVGRKSQTIVTPAGLNVHPEDIESALRRQPGVAECAVVPRRIPAGSEAAAVMVFRGSAEAAQHAILAANEELAEYQKIRYWRPWPDLNLPRTSTGKVKLRVLEEWVNADTVTGTQTTGDPILAAIYDAGGHADSAQPDDDSRLNEDLGLDSLGRVQLQDKLEQRLGLTLDDIAVQQAVTLGDLRRILGLQPPSALSAAGAGAIPVAPAVATTSRQQDRYPLWPWSWPMRAIRAVFTEAIARPLVWLFAKPKVPRAHELVTAKSPMLVVANHVGTYDVPLALYGLPSPLRRRIAVAMAADILRDWRNRRGSDLWLPSLFGPITWLLVTALFNVFPLPRNAGFRRSFEHAGQALDRGLSVLIFPEGRRTGGALAEFRPGIGLLVQQTGVPVLPVAIAGAGPSSAHRRHSGSIEIRVGTPLRFTPDETPETITARLHAEIARLLT